MWYAKEFQRYGDEGEREKEREIRRHTKRRETNICFQEHFEYVYKHMKLQNLRTVTPTVKFPFEFVRCNLHVPQTKWK